MDGQDKIPPDDRYKGKPIDWAALDSLHDAAYTDTEPFCDPSDFTQVPPPPKLRIRRFLACPTCGSHQAAITKVTVVPIHPSPSPAPIREVSVTAAEAQCRHINGSGPQPNPADTQAKPGVALLCACINDHEFTLRFAFSAENMATAVETYPHDQLGP